MACPRAATVALIALYASSVAAFAQETEQPRPWIALSGHNAGAVGTCPDVDGGEGNTCYIVRCEKKAGPVFVIQTTGGEEEDVRSVRLGIGGYKAVIKLDKGRSGERPPNKTLNLTVAAFRFRAARGGCSGPGKLARR